MYDTILVPTDGNPGMNSVAREAVDLAELTGATVHALSVVDPRTVPDDAEAASDASDADAGRGVNDARAASDATDRVAELAGERGLSATTAVRSGRPYEEILDYADEADADLVVMGTHGRAGLDRYLLGSVAERVVRAAPVPVLTVNLSEHGAGVTDREDAVAVATQAVAEAGYEVSSVTEDPYRESTSWIVRVEAADGSAFNVHVNAATRDTRVARVDPGGE